MDGWGFEFDEERQGLLKASSHIITSMVIGVREYVYLESEEMKVIVGRHYAHSPQDGVLLRF